MPKRGQVVELISDENPNPSVVYIHGHFMEEEFRGLLAEARAYLEGLNDHLYQDWDCPRLEVGQSVWARWGFAEDPYWGRAFHCPVSKGRGAFPVTEVIDMDQREALHARKAAIEDRAQQLEAFALEWFPEATNVKAYRYPVLTAGVDFRLPGLEGSVGFRMDQPETVSVQTRDLDRWHAIYGARKRPAVPQVEVNL